MINMVIIIQGQENIDLTKIQEILPPAIPHGGALAQTLAAHVIKKDQSKLGDLEVISIQLSPQYSDSWFRFEITLAK